MSDTTFIDKITVIEAPWLNDVNNMVYGLPQSSGSSLVGHIASGTGATATTVQAVLRETINVNRFGAVGDGVTDDTPAFQKAIDYLRANGGGTVTFTGRHLIDTNLYVEDYVSLVGNIDLPDEVLDGVRDYDHKKSLLIINPTITITVRSGSSVSRCIVLRKGLDLPYADATAAAAGVAAFSGTAFTTGGAGAYLHHMLILGFSKAIYSTNLERVRCEYIQGDNTNGIELNAVLDVAYVENCHFWPFTTTHQTWTTAALNVRTGTAYKFANVGDWSKLTNCFSFGYQTGFDINACDHVNLIGCSADNDTSLTSTSIGFTIEGTSKETLLLGCQAAAQGTGVKVDVTSSGGGGTVVKIDGCDFWNNDSQAIYVNAGRALISGTTFRSNNAAIVTSATADGATVVNCDFESETTPYNFGGAAPLRKSVFWSNRFVSCTDPYGNRQAAESNPTQITGTKAAASNTGLELFGRMSRGTLGTPTISSDGDIPLRYVGMAWDGVDFQQIATQRCQLQGAPSAGSTRGQWIFATTDSASTTPVDRFSIYGNGSMSPLSDNAYSCGISGLRFSAIWAANGTIQTSDARTKEDIEDASLGLSFINSLRPVSYRFTVGGNQVVRQVYRDVDGNECDHSAAGAQAAEILTTPVPGTRTHWGLIAQEVKAATEAAGVDFGGWLLTDKDNPDSQQALRYDQFIAPLIKAVQELSAQIEQLKAGQP